LPVAILFTSYVNAIPVEVSQTQPEAVKIKSQDDSESPFNEQGQAKYKHHSTNNSTTSVDKIIRPVLKTTDTTENTELTSRETAKTHESWFSWKLSIADVFTILFMALLAFFNYLLWRSTDKLWKASIGTLGTMKDTSQRQLRAYVALETIEHDEIEDMLHRRLWPERLKIRIKNYGQTPAHHVSIIHKVFDAEQPHDYTIPETVPGDPLSNQMLHPGQAFNNYIDITKQPIDRILESGLRSQTTIYFYGRIDYMDTFNQWWITYFCQRYDPKKPEGKRCAPHSYHNYEHPIP
jgi:hypothetical protein